MALFFGFATALAQAHLNLIIPVSIEQTQAIELGDIYNFTNGVCELTANGRQGNACSASNTSLGKLLVRGEQNQRIQVTVKPTSNGAVAFTPILPNGKQTLSLSLSDVPTELYIGGELIVETPSSLGGMSLDYVIEVNYQ